MIFVFRYVSRIVRPISAIADQLARMNPNERDIRLPGDYKGYEVRQITEAINQYLERMNGFIERERFFTAAASHELRTPITVIRTSAELAGNVEPPHSSVNGYIKRINRAARGMEEIVEGLLFLAREPEDAFLRRLPSISVHEVVRSTIDRTEHFNKHEAACISFDYNGELNIRADQIHLSIVLGNLFRNALTHTPQSEIKVFLSDSALTISDAGYGIALDDLNHIFKRGYRGRDNGGHGLGLYISKTICDRYGWKLQLSSTPDVGTSAEIRF